MFTQGLSEPSAWPSGQCQIDMAGCPPLRGLGLLLATACRGSISDANLRGVLVRHTSPPTCSVGIDFPFPDGQLELNALELYYDAYDAFGYLLASGLPPIPFERLPDIEVARAYLPSVRLPGSSHTYTHLSHFLQLAEYGQRKGVKLRSRKNCGALDVDGLPAEPCVEETPQGDVLRHHLDAFLSAFPEAHGHVTRIVADQFGASWTSADAEDANATMSHLLGVPVDVRAGTLVRPSEIAEAISLAFGGHHAPEPWCNDFLANGMPRIRAASVSPWGGADLAGAMWSCALDVRLNHPGHADNWRRAMEHAALVYPFR